MRPLVEVANVDQQQPPGSHRPVTARSTGSDLFVTLISAALFLYVGFGLGLVGVTDNPLYDGSVAALVWGARVVGVGLLVVAVLVALKLPFADALDFFLAALASAGCLVIGAIWIAFGTTANGFLLILFGLLNGHAARTAWLRWRVWRRASP
jgi:hypothetical protein